MRLAKDWYDYCKAWVAYNAGELPVENMEIVVLHWRGVIEKAGLSVEEHKWLDKKKNDDGDHYYYKLSDGEVYRTDEPL